MKQLTGLISALPHADKRGLFQSQLRSVEEMMTKVETGVRDEVHAIGTEVQYSMILLMRITQVLEYDKKLLDDLTTRGLAPELKTHYEASIAKIETKTQKAAAFTRDELWLPISNSHQAEMTFSHLPEGRDTEEPIINPREQRDRQRRAA
jgi:hypothetical protein